MANSTISLTSLDFDLNKQNLKEYLKTQTSFKDYDFDGSNMSVLLDVLSYNTFKNTFYLNMIASEMFLDTAQKYDSVISHAKELNYVPKSTRSSAANVDITFLTSGIRSLVVPKGTRFSGVNSNGSYTFTTNRTSVYTSGNSTFNVTDMQLFEGTYFQDSYVVNYEIENQQFLITNKNADITSITVNIIEDNGLKITEFLKAENLYGLNNLSEVYFIQGAQNNNYEIVFGDGLFGRRPLNGSVVQISYRVSVGPDADGVTEFTLVEDLEDSNVGGSITVQSISTSSNSAGGTLQESINSIKFAAPRFFATQQRAVSSDDYESLIISNFGNEISDIRVFGGQELEPKMYGRTVLALKPRFTTAIPDFVKSRIENYLKEYIALPNRIIIIDPDYIYAEVNSTVQYRSNSTTKSPSEIQTTVLNSVKKYSIDNIELFGKDLRFSKLVNQIDLSDTSITSNKTELRLIKRWTPAPNALSAFSFSYENKIRFINTSGSQLQPLGHPAMFESSPFIYTKDGVDYEVRMQDNGRGSIYLYSRISNRIVLIENNVGTINYTTGKVDLNLRVKSYVGAYIELFARTVERDIFASKNKILIIDPSNIKINVVEELN